MFSPRCLAALTISSVVRWAYGRDEAPNRPTVKPAGIRLMRARWRSASAAGAGATARVNY
eukprot:COSAG01_NODE_2435_length_7701_cov_7.604709_7_plen_60_part_00